MTVQPSGSARVWMTAMVCGWQSLSTKKAGGLGLGAALAERHGFGGSCRLIQQRSIRDVETGEIRHHGLEVEERLETALAEISGW